MPVHRSSSQGVCVYMYVHVYFNLLSGFVCINPPISEEWNKAKEDTRKTRCQVCSALF